ncbi:MAG: 1,2-phenylacetyl-CoA epoxidase subunit PaaD [Vulcanimicrobiaceae bacterium]
MTPDVAQVWEWLATVPDPEIPVLSVVDLGIVRDVAWRGGNGERGLRVTITPTYSGCPAMRTIEREIERVLHARGVERVALDVQLAPAWTTDWILPAAREKLRAYGIAPPDRTAGDALDIGRFVETGVTCPRCGSTVVTLTSAFGSTPCKSLYRCTTCLEPFDHFKCH